MPVRLMPATIIDREHIPLWSAKPVDFAVSSIGESGGMWRFVIENTAYLLDPAKADSVGKTNFIDPSRTYPLDGDLSTTGTYVSTTSNGWVDADVGVDMSVVSRYVVLVRVGCYSSYYQTYCVVGLFGSADLVTWVQLWEVQTNSGGEVIAHGLVKPGNFRAFKVMFRRINSDRHVYCRTYELSVYRV